MIVYKQGNLLESGCNVICHQTNCMGAMGSGIAKQIRAQFPTVYKTFLDTYNSKGNKLGNIDVIPIGEKFVVNMYSQKEYLPRTVRHTNYEAFRECVKKIKEYFYNEREDIIIGFPAKIGCGLAGGDWTIVRAIIEEEFATDWRIEIWELT